MRVHVLVFEDIKHHAFCERHVTCFTGSASKLAQARKPETAVCSHITTQLRLLRVKVDKNNQILHPISVGVFMSFNQIS